ncbi:MAG: DedA family protein [bacterium]
MGDAQAWFDWISALPLAWGLSVIAASALIEYIFPPFPGDTVVVVAAVLVPNAGWPFAAVFGVVLLGSLVGAMLSYALGRWVANLPPAHWLARRLSSPSMAPRIEKVVTGFQKHGSVYILLNRFLPAFRSVFFVAAGMAGLPPLRVALFAVLSAAFWNAALMGAGWLVGYNLTTLASWVESYGLAVLLAMLATAIFWWFRSAASKKRRPDA